MPKVNLRLSDQELLEIRARARQGRRSLQKQIVYELFHGGGATEVVSLAPEPAGDDGERSDGGAIPPAADQPPARKSAPTTLYAKDCRNADYHYLGPCRFCGGGKPL